MNLIRKYKVFYEIKIFYNIFIQINKIQKPAAWPSGKAEDCKSFIPQFESGCRLYFSLFSFFEQKPLKLFISFKLNMNLKFLLSEMKFKIRKRIILNKELKTQILYILFNQQFFFIFKI